MFWVGALVSLCYVPGVTGAFIATQWPILAVLMPFALFRSGPFTIWHGFGLAFIAYATAHAWSTPTPQASMFGLWLIWIMGLCVWFGSTLERDVQDDVKNLYKGLAVGAIASSALGVFQHFGVEWPATVTSAPAGLYVNSIQQGTVLALVFVALMTEGLWKWALPLLPGLVLADSRGAWLALAVGVLGLGIRRAWLLGFVAVGLAVYMFALPLSPSDQQRMLIWGVAWHGLNWLGWGPGVFYSIMIPQPGGGWLFPEHAHNDALQLAFEYGVGAAPVFAIFALALRRTADREWPTVLAFLTAGCYSPALWMPVASFLALVTVGRILRNHAVAVGHRDRSRQDVVPRRRGDARTGREAVPVASYHSAEG